MYRHILKINNKMLKLPRKITVVTIVIAKHTIVNSYFHCCKIINNMDSLSLLLFCFLFIISNKLANIKLPQIMFELQESFYC